MFCTNCGTQLPDGSQFCTECGQPLGDASGSTTQVNETTPLDDATRVMPSAQQSSSADNSVQFCTNCGARIPDGCAFCVECGAPVYGSENTPDSTAQNVAIPSEMLGNNYQAPRRKKNTGLIVGAIIAAVIIIGCGSVVGLHYFGVFGDPPFLRFLPMKEQPADTSEDTNKDEEKESKDSSDKNSSDSKESKDSDDKKDSEDKKDSTDSNEDSSSDSSSNSSSSSSNSSSSSKSTGSSGNSSSSSTSSSSDYVLPDSATHVYTKDELSSLSNWELYIARNEIYARHGRGFQNQDLRDYFAGKSWYTERYSPEAFDSQVSLNSVEQQNADTILEIERARGSQYIS